jgi:hypothetical protein
MFKDMIGRGFGFDERLLVVINGGKGLAKAVVPSSARMPLSSDARCTRWPTFCTTSAKQITSSVNHV